jgi:hypothetical protein
MSVVRDDRDAGKQVQALGCHVLICEITRDRVDGGKGVGSGEGEGEQGEVPRRGGGGQVEDGRGWRRIGKGSSTG